MTKKFTAKQMNHAPAQVFRAADRDGKAEIEHSHYKDRVFELTARDRVVENNAHNVRFNSVPSSVDKSDIRQVGPDARLEGAKDD